MKNLLILLVIIGFLSFNPNISRAKENNEQDKIILLNDSAAAIEDTNPDLSKGLTQLADEKQKEWENQTANKDAQPLVVTSKDIPRLEKEVKLLQAAALVIKPNYPIIAKSLRGMARDINRSIENEK